jgi:hypothetical protein
LQALHKRTWLAVRGKGPEVVLNDLGLRTGMASTSRARPSTGFFMLEAINPTMFQRLFGG